MVMQLACHTAVFFGRWVTAQMRNKQLAEEDIGSVNCSHYWEVSFLKVAFLPGTLCLNVVEQFYLP